MPQSLKSPHHNAAPEEQQARYLIYTTVLKVPGDGFHNSL